MGDQLARYPYSAALCRAYVRPHATRFRRKPSAWDEYNDANAITAITAKTEEFEQQLGPEYDKVLNGLDQIDFSSDEGQRMAATFYSLQQKCEEQKEE